MADGSQIKLDELDRLLNDPDVPMEAARVWELLDELSDAAARREVAARTGQSRSQDREHRNSTTSVRVATG